MTKDLLIVLILFIVSSLFIYESKQIKINHLENELKHFKERKESLYRNESDTLRQTEYFNNKYILR